MAVEDQRPQPGIAQKSPQRKLSQGVRADGGKTGQHQSHAGRGPETRHLKSMLVIPNTHKHALLLDLNPPIFRIGFRQGRASQLEERRPVMS